jgi:hypothetical protein
VPENRITRRKFLETAGKLGGAAIVSSLAGATGFAQELEGAVMDGFWAGGAFRQDCVDASGESSGSIRARVGGVWREFRLAALPDTFMDWNLTSRLEMLSGLSDLMSGRGGAPPSLSGPHNAAMATLGYRRDDSILEVNNAFKGMGLCPARGIIRDRIAEMTETMGAPMPEKMGFLQRMYSDSSNFDLTKLVSLELYSTPEFETHTFLNLMSEPVTSLVFLDSLSFEVRGIGQLVDHSDEEANDYARSIVSYTNIAHSYFHGDFPRMFPGILVHVVEVFDNTPGTGRGVLISG